MQLLKRASKRCNSTSASAFGLDLAIARLTSAGVTLFLHLIAPLFIQGSAELSVIKCICIVPKGELFFNCKGAAFLNSNNFEKEGFRLSSFCKCGYLVKRCPWLWQQVLECEGSHA